jgi:hypothetical protein
VNRFSPDADYICLGRPGHESKEPPGVAGQFQAPWTIGEMGGDGFRFVDVQLSGIKRHDVTIVQT